MAVDLSKYNFFNRMDARSRIFVLIATVVGFVVLIYLGTKLLSGGSATTGPSRVATAPAGLQSVQGGTLTPEYRRALEQANAQNAATARLSGTSAVPTLINYGGMQNTSANCNIICSDQTANVKTLLDDWQRQGKISPEVASALQALADKNVSVGDYAAELDRLVKEGKLTPEQARELLEQYKKQHANALLQDSAKTMDALIKNGMLPLDAANALLTAQKNNTSPADYAAQLAALARQGKISPEVAQQLLAQYSQQRAKEITAQSIAELQELSRQGLIIPEILNSLIDLETRMVPMDQFAASVQKFVDDGRLAPASATKILDEFNSQKKAIGTTGTVDAMLQKAEQDAYAEINELLRTGKITQDVASLLTSMIQRNVPFNDFQNAVNQLVQQKKLTPEIGKLKIADYQRVKGLRDLAARLAALQANNASAADYADELKRAVQAGLLTPEQAAQLMREYQALTAPTGVTGGANVPTTADFEKLQQGVAQGAGAQVATPSEFAVVQTTQPQESLADRQARLEALMNAMSGQAAQLIQAWQPPTMVERVGTYVTEMTTRRREEGPAGGPPGKGLTPPTELMAGAPIVKAGTILFAVLDTTVNSDYPDSPVLATIVSGPFKGAKLLGKLITTKSVAGQMDRISLNFTMMNMDQWPKSKSVTSYAIDPDTAKTALATSVNYHYLMRFGATMATAFLQGYANAITTSSSTTSTGIFGTSTTHPALDPRQKLLVGLGQVGQTLGAATANYINIPPTVKIDAGVGIGILFMNDVT